jgi:hypothetical protein
MTPELARFISNTRETFTRLSIEQLYQLALSLRHELERRNLDARPEADALVAALLVAARVEHREIFSSDCAASGAAEASAGGSYYSRQNPARPAPAEM